MLTTVRGYYDDGNIVLEEKVSVAGKADVIVTFLDENEIREVRVRIPGAMKGKVSLPDDFNEPLDDYKDYM